jgi:protein-disulfide isomerase-like protein with CxxC motif
MVDMQKRRAFLAELGDKLTTQEFIRKSVKELLPDINENILKDGLDTCDMYVIQEIAEAIGFERGKASTKGDMKRHKDFLALGGGLAEYTNFGTCAGSEETK